MRDAPPGRNKACPRCPYLMLEIETGWLCTKCGMFIAREVE